MRTDQTLTKRAAATAARALAAISIALAGTLPAPVAFAATVPVQRSDACAIPLDASRSLRDRVADPAPAIVETYRQSGAQDVKPHRLTDAEWDTVEEAISALPRVHRDVLQRHLRRISFVDAGSGGGNALTSPAEPECGALFDLTLRAGLLQQSLSDFLTAKEATLFADDGSGMTVRFEAGEMAVLPYILLHESTHIVDGVLHLSNAGNGAFRKGVWRGDRGNGLASPYAETLVNGIRWRGGNKLPVGDAAKLYQGLRQTPFVSLYASAAAAEEFAELVAWQALSSRWGIRPTISVQRADGSVAYRYSPLDSPLVRERLRSVAKRSVAAAASSLRRT